MVERRKRCALPAEVHIGRTKIPNDRLLQHLRQYLTIACLMCPAAAGIMGESLAVKADQLRLFQRCQRLGMRRLNQLRHIRNIVILPTAQCGTQLGLFTFCKGSKSSLPKAVNTMPVGFDLGHIHPVERCARHGSHRLQNAILQHALSLPPDAPYRVA